VGGAAATTLAGSNGTLTLMANGTFTYAANAAVTASASGYLDQFPYCAKGTTPGAAGTTITLNPAAVESASGITCSSSSFNARTASSLAVKPPGVLANCKDAL